MADSSYSLLMDEAILEHGSPNMLPYQVPRGHGPGFSSEGYLFTLGIVKGRLLYQYPWGGVLLTLPAVAVFEAAGLRIAPGGIYDVEHEGRIQEYLTTILCAFIVWLFFDIAALTLPLGWSFTMAISAAFGTQIWSSASRSLWPHNWNLLLLTVAISLLVRERARPITLSTALAWACFARPQCIPTAAIIGIYLWIEYGFECFTEYAIVGAVWGAVFAFVMEWYFGQLMPPICQYGVDLSGEFFRRLEGVLISPARGLVVFVPITLVPIYLGVRYWRVLPGRRLVILSVAAIALEIVMNASWQCWWGGSSYGPRLLVETIPWLLLLAILSIKPFLGDRQVSMQACAAVMSCAIMLLILSVVMNGVGAFSVAANVDWNQSVNDCSLRNPPALWQWQRPPFLAWAQNS